jgi:hypothetical protein
MNAKNLLDEVAELRLLVDSLCAAVLVRRGQKPNSRRRTHD